MPSSRETPEHDGVNALGLLGSGVQGLSGSGSDLETLNPKSSS